VSAPRPPAAPGRRLTLRSGGGLLLLAAAISLLAMAWIAYPILTRDAPALRGDGRNPDSYGFDLAGASVPRAEIVASGMSVDGVAPLIDPPSMPAEGVDRMHREERGKYLVAGDRVVGVVVGNEARAYPLRVLNWHEVANDTLGGVPIAVTFSPLTDSVVVFDRRVGGEALVFGVSGLLYNSNQLLYEHRPAGTASSLWSQLLFRAVAGPAAADGRTLTVLPSQVVRWDAWRAARPETSVLDPDRTMLKRYRGNPYGMYFGSDLLRYPVKPLPASPDPPYKTPVLVVRSDAGRAVLEIRGLARRAGPDGSVRVETAAGPVPVRAAEEPPTALVEPGPGAPQPVAHASWFAWHAMYPDDPLVR
jgi:hypothetical protein